MTYRFVEHVGEVALELEAEEEAAPARHEIELAGADRALLLADWLGELVLLAEVERFVPDRVAVLELDAGRLRAVVVGRRRRPSHLVKAVTLNNLELAEEGGARRARVVLDV